ncbi:hypothetical protein BFW89_25375 [Pseudomonas synxantha]|uniref:Uncharacterized protein n=1 Tax=Pseudomonas synxantha TaxID=47883 RepID=A0A5D3G7Y0_9PSED|nr:hypothetical protein [Pseudomonas sp. W2Aug9]MCK3853057.1 hypothetical protein [Pseudomonas sp. W2Jun17]OPA99338.1 hypothetical protein BFW89_25375 [Pseudomonas synxantha]TYK56502.1 hypothetical protein FXO26_19200 [Pseudomonas synxantha]
MFHLPPFGVSACLRHTLCAVRSSRVNAHAPANILDGPSDLLFTNACATHPPIFAVPIMILHNFGVRNATLGQMAGKLLP